MSGVIPDGLRMDPHSPAAAGVQKTGELESEVIASECGAGDRIRTDDLPFTRQREVVRARTAPILPVPGMPGNRRSHRHSLLRLSILVGLQKSGSWAMRTPKGLPTNRRERS